MKGTMRLAWIVMVLGCAGAEPAVSIAEETPTEGAEDRETAYVYGPPITWAEASPPPPPPAPARVPPPLPSARAPAAALEPGPALAAGDAAYAEALALPLGVTEPESTLQATAERLVERVMAVSTALAEMNEAYDAEATTPALVALSRVRRGDAHDLVAARVLDAPFVLPAQLHGTAPAARAQVELRLRQALRDQARALFCFAATHYRAALDGEHTPAVRARAQLAAYGESFLSSCVDDSAAR